MQFMEVGMCKLGTRARVGVVYLARRSLYVILILHGFVFAIFFSPLHTQQPMIFCIENNQYGMGTSIDRHSSIQDYYKMGNAIPGLRIDGMNVLAVREGMRFAREHCASGHGPMYIEMMTYRYHGHSMSDPGTTYRNREEIAFTRSTRDPLEFIRYRMRHCE